MKKFILTITTILFIFAGIAIAADGDPVLEGKTATGNIITTGVFEAGTAATVPGAVTLFDEGVLTFWDDGDDFSTYFRMFDGTTQLGFWGILNVSSNVIAGGSFLPDSNDGTYIGSTALGFSDGYFADGAVVYFGNDQDVTLTHIADTGLTVNLNIAAATYGSDESIADADLLAIDDGAATTIAVGGGVGSPMTWGTDIPTAVTIGTKYIYRADGTDVAIADGGTGVGTASAGFDALSPMTTVGDLIYGGASGTGTRLAAGATTEILVGGGAAAPVWTTATGTGAPARAGSPAFTTQITAPIIQLTGGNIVFPATAVPVAGVNTLDDYQEGTWTPVFTSTAASFTHNIQHASYTIIGNRCSFNLFVGSTGATGTLTNAVYINLPVTPKSTADLNQACYIGYIRCVDYPANAMQLTADIRYNAAQIRLWFSMDDGDTVAATAAEFDGAAQIIISGTYQID